MLLLPFYFVTFLLQKTGVLTTLTSADIVRKAKVLADTNADRWKDSGIGAKQRTSVIVTCTLFCSFSVTENRSVDDIDVSRY